MKTNIDFVSKRKFFIVLSLALVIISGIFVFTKGLNLGVDFTGGLEISILVPDVDTSVGEVRDLLPGEYKDARIVKQKPLAGEAAEEQARFSIIINTDETADSAIAEIVEALSSEGVTSKSVVSTDRISGYAAQEIKGYAWTTVVVAVALILLYITVRFKFSFGVGAIIALVHDIVITLGFYSIFGMEFNAPVIAALLTLLGYSLNDTIVVYDRVRENIKKFRGKPIEEIVNKSINEVIVRSLNTSFTTFIAVLTLFIFSGEVLRPFAFGMLVGVIVGTYSSLYIAAPIVISWLNKSAAKIH